MRYQNDPAREGVTSDMCRRWMRLCPVKAKKPKPKTKQKTMEGERKCAP